MPLHINISRLDDGDGIHETLVNHNAKWHKACYVMCNATKVERAKKQQDPGAEELVSPIKQHLH